MKKLELIKKKLLYTTKTILFPVVMFQVKTAAYLCQEKPWADNKFLELHL